MGDFKADQLLPEEAWNIFPFFPLLPPLLAPSSNAFATLIRNNIQLYKLSRSKSLFNG